MSRETKLFKAPLKVCFGDIDYAGIVYYPRFLHYFHLALEEFFSAELKTDYPTVLGKHRVGFPTVHLETDFRLPLSYGDRIEVEVRVLQLGRTSITWGYRAFRIEEGDPLVVEARQVTVCLDMDSFAKVPIPDWLRQELEAYRRRTS